MAIINPFIAIVGFTCVGNYVILSASIQKGGNLIIYYLFLLPAIATTKVMIQGKLIKNKTKSLRDVFLLNGWIFLASAVILAVIYRPELPDLSTLCVGLLLVIGTMMMQISYCFAFREGSVSLCTTVTGFNIIFPVLLGVLRFGETLTTLRIVGLVLLPIAFVLVSYKNDGGGTGRKWLFFTLTAFLGAGFSNCVLSILSRHESVYNKGAYLICNYLISAAVCLTVALCLQRKDTPAISGKLKLSVGISLVGLTLGLYNTLFVKALGVLDHVVLYPVSEILSTCLIALGDRILFDNHFTKKQLVGLAFAVATVTLLNL